jgi:hypothetical protein
MLFNDNLGLHRSAKITNNISCISKIVDVPFSSDGDWIVEER